MVDAVANFLIAGETDPNWTVSDFRMGHEVSGGFHDHGHACLVVGAEQRGPIRGDDRMAFELGELRILRGAQNTAGVSRQNDIPAVIATMDDRLDVVAAGFG